MTSRIFRPVMDMERYLGELSGEQREVVTAWVCSEPELRDTVVIEPISEGEARVTRYSRSFVHFLRSHCAGQCAELLKVRHRVKLSSPPPWLSPTWVDDSDREPAP